MIKSYADYKEYLRADKISLGRRGDVMEYIFDDIWRFQRILRKTEYLKNCRGNRLRYILSQIRLKRISKRLGFTIPLNVFGAGLSIAHYGTIVVNGGAKIGANCRLHVGVNIGTEAGKSDAAPTIGDNCYIGPGAKIFGSINIGSGVVIGANAVVNKDFGDAVTLGGIPASIISEKSSEGLLVLARV